jgi:universal stress protein A
MLSPRAVVGNFMARRVLVAYDFIETADGALRWAAEFARETASSVILLHVGFIAPVAVVPEVVVPVPLPSPEEIKAIEKRLRESAARVGLSAGVEVVVGASVGATIVARAEELKVDLIVMGTHGRRPIVRALLGSTADHVVRHAHCPVVTVRDHR